MRKLKRYEVILIVLIVTFVNILLLYFSYKIYDYELASHEYNSLADKHMSLTIDKVDYKDLIEQDPSLVSEDNKLIIDDTGRVIVNFDNKVVEYPYVKNIINYDSLKEQNNDYIAWISIPAVNIEYPVVREPETDYYLYRTFEGKDSKSGCLFQDLASNPNFDGYLNFIFGHNMRNLTMFGYLKSLRNVTSDLYVYIYLKDKVITYKIYSMYEDDASSYTYSNVNKEEEYDKYLQYTLDKSEKELYTSDSKYKSILALSTCSKTDGKKTNFIVQCIKVAECDSIYEGE